MLTWFDNPPRRGGKRRKLYGAAAKAHAKAQRRKKGVRKMAKRRSSRKKLYGAAAAAHAKARRRGGSKRRRASVRRSAPRRSRRSWRRTSVQTARRAGRQLRYRRTNPPLGRGLVGQLINGVQDAGFIVGGKVASRIIAGFIPVTAGGMAVNLAVQAAAALAAGYAGKFISPNASRMMLAGGLTGVIETFIKSLNIPMVSSALAGSDDLAAYPTALAPGISAYPGLSAYPQGLLSDSSDEDMIYQ